MKKLVIIDGHSLAYRAYHALPYMSNSKGVPTQAIYGFLNMLFKVIESENPDKLIVAFDTPEPTQRHIMYKEYKAGRKQTPDDLLEQMPLLIWILQQSKIAVASKAGLEADDFLGILSRQAEKENMIITIVTGDKDALQLITDKTTVLLTKKGISETLRVDEAELFNMYGIKPEQIVELKGLMGDSSDNIPGIKGVGEKTALKLLSEYQTVENVINNSDSIKGKLKEKIENDADMARLSRDLAKINTNPDEIDLDILNNSDAANIDFYSAINIIGELELKAIINKINRMSIASPDKDIQGFELDEKIEQTDKIEINQKDIDVFEDATNLLQQLKGKDIYLVYSDEFTIYCDETLYNINIKKDLISNGMSFEEADRLLKLILNDNDVKKYLFDKKRFLHICDNPDLNCDFDALIAAYLLKPTTSVYEIEQLCSDYCSLKRSDAYALYVLCNKLKDELELNELIDVYDSIERPLINVLYDMEKDGFAIDINELKVLGNEFDKTIAQLKASILDYAGEDFNILSPKQLGVILFEKLKLPYTKKTKTGYSTDIETLEFLSDKHPIAKEILDYRHITKLKSTYIDGLLNVQKNGRVYSNFNQTVTATGRISSTDPNLQNIPIRTQDGRKIRRAFIASQGNVLVGGDYSQIELRVLAHFSGDENLIEAFIAGQDIHASTAAQVAGISLDDVTPEQRSAAKAVNFGIVYGISDFGLAKQLDISRKEAGEDIQAYLAKYPGIKKYMDLMIELGKKNGYTQTLFGRKRFLPELKSKNYNVRSFGERVAMNAPIQGTAADIIKIAMIQVDRFLKDNNLKSKLILQVHDELIIDTAIDEQDLIKDKLKNIMENVIKLDVPLIVDIGIGENWYETK